ncbi:hypothetical protein Mpal_0886 [Methanosphaerula palustris E1-9c]|uniref:Uncharacterized protein n=1 Tax=Methanosphaerula palustris (strain ATCC BAA-1556 / DSM 19958 / E1-9c) TaxID=521011 RepID=B8GGI9_METPE|nr:hypothetical protein Mpal_0886 [Methanosphaerula palustris E1-9c]
MINKSKCIILSTQDINVQIPGVNRRYQNNTEGEWLK